MRHRRSAPPPRARALIILNTRLSSVVNYRGLNMVLHRRSRRLSSGVWHQHTKRIIWVIILWAGSRARFPSFVHQRHVISMWRLLAHNVSETSYLHNCREDAASRACGTDMVMMRMAVMLMIRSRGLLVSCCSEICAWWKGRWAPPVSAGCCCYCCLSEKWLMWRERKCKRDVLHDEAYCLQCLKTGYDCIIRLSDQEFRLHKVASAVRRG